MPGCKVCGVAEQREGTFCHLDGRVIDPLLSDCPHFVRLIYEEGEPLTPIQHLLLIRDDARARKMRGPV